MFHWNQLKIRLLNIKLLVVIDLFSVEHTQNDKYKN